MLYYQGGHVCVHCVCTLTYGAAAGLMLQFYAMFFFCFFFLFFFTFGVLMLPPGARDGPPSQKLLAVFSIISI